MSKLKFEGIPVGTYIRAYDFEPIEGRKDCFIEGTIKSVVDKGFLAYAIVVEYDSWDEDVSDIKPEHSRVGVEYFVPLESTFDYDGRVEVLPVLSVARAA